MRKKRAQERLRDRSKVYALAKEELNAVERRNKRKGVGKSSSKGKSSMGTNSLGSEFADSDDLSNTGTTSGKSSTLNFRKPRWETYTGRLSGGKLVYENQREGSRLNVKDDLYDCEMVDGESTSGSAGGVGSGVFGSGKGSSQASGDDYHVQRNESGSSDVHPRREAMESFLDIVRRM